MKKLILIIIILSASFAFSQFEKIEEGKLSDEYRATLAYFPKILSDNSILLSFKFFNSSHNKPLIFKVDFNGKFIWEAENEYYWMFNFWDIVEKNNNEIRILGFRDKDSTIGGTWFGSYYDLTIDKNGKKIKEISTMHDIDKNLEAAPWANLSLFKNQIVENTYFLENGTKVYYSRLLNDNYQSFDTIFRYENIIDCNDYYFAKNQNNQFVNLLTMKEKGAKNDYKIIFLDEDLKIIDSMNYTGAWLGNSFIYSNNKFFGITRTEELYYKSPNLLIKKDFQTNKETIIEFGDSTQYKIAGMLPDGNILLYGKKYNILDSCQYSILTVIDENANIISNQYLSDCGANYIAFATIFDKDKVVISGQNGDFPFWQILKYKTLGIEKNEFTPSNIFPNPATDYLNISFDSPKEGIGTIEIIDLLGKKVCSFETYINEGNNSIKYSELDNLQTASYTVKVTINNEIVSIGKFIKN